MMPRIVLITNDSQPGQRVLRAMHEQGIRLDAVLMLTGPLGLPRLRGAGTLGRLLRWPRSLASGLRRRLRYLRGRRASYAALCQRVEAVGAMNGSGLRRALRRLRPDLVLLGGGGILDAETIACARVGVLNAHPALLPWIRGCGVQGHSLENGVALGASVHWVDPGIDTGRVIARRLLEIPEGASALELQWRGEELGARLLAEVVAGMAAGGEPPAGHPQAVRYPLFRWPDAAGMAAHVTLAESGRPAELLARWQPLCTDEVLTLPAGDFEPPAGVTLAPLRPAPEQAT